MMGAAVASFGMIAELAFEWAVRAWGNSDSAFAAVQVPAGSATFFQLGFCAMTDSYPWANSVALLSVGSPFISMKFTGLTFHAFTQSAKPVPMSFPTATLSKLM